MDGTVEAKNEFQLANKKSITEAHLESLVTNWSSINQFCGP